MEGLTEGRMVHYVTYNNRHLAAIVIGHMEGATALKHPISFADLAVFMNMDKVNGLKNFGLQFHSQVAYSEDKEPGTWHWIEKA
jgi:hypothetical protein